MFEGIPVPGDTHELSVEGKRIAGRRILGVLCVDGWSCPVWVCVLGLFIVWDPIMYFLVSLDLSSFGCLFVFSIGLFSFIFLLY